MSDEHPPIYPPPENLLWQTKMLRHTQIWSHIGLVESLTMDRQGGNPNRQHQYGLQELNEIKQNCDLIEICRTQNKFKTQFTYENDILNVNSRIDHFYLWNHVGKNYSIRSDIVPNTLSDHHIISLSLVNITTNKRGSSYWKLKTSVLQNKEYKQKIETFYLHWKNKKNIYSDQTKWCDIYKKISYIYKK